VRRFRAVSPKRKIFMEISSAVSAFILAAVLAVSLLGSPDSARAAGTRITVSNSEFGPMVWGPKRQAIYVFQRDSFKRSRCYGECAEAWPPVYTTGKPVAGSGARRGLLGTIRRRDGRRQVTYRGRPLYYYAHEGAGQVLCHDVDLNGGLWWVIGADGKRRP
jgi:predicted lipoprotein with Yx(FWY)xxD motif